MDTTNDSSGKSRGTAYPLIVFGEVLYDCFPDGKKVLGGAPFNVAWHLRGLGREPVFVSAVGDDADGRAIREAMESWGLNTAGLQTAESAATGRVEVSLDNGDPSYEILRPRAWDCVDDRANLRATGILYHGTLALRSDRTRETLEALSDRSEAQRYLDLNLRPPDDDLKRAREWVAGVTWLKLNLAELAQLLGEDAIPFADAEKHTSRIRTDLGIHNVLVTAGADGALLDGQYGQAVVSPAPKPEAIVDTVGAGDSFSAVSIHGILERWPAQKVLERAGLVAARVCGLSGATTTDKILYEGINHGK